MRFLQHVAVISAFAIVAAVIIFGRPQGKTAGPVASPSGAQVAVVQR